MATPLQIEIAIHYCSTADDDYGDPEKSSPAIEDAIKDFVSEGFLKKRHLDKGPKYAATNGLKMWVAELCRVPFPVQRWVMPDDLQAEMAETLPEPRGVNLAKLAS